MENNVNNSLKKTKQITMRLEKDIIDRLKEISRKRSYEKKIDVFYTDLIREAILKTFF